MTPSVIEPATFQLLAQCLNQLRHQQRAPISHLGLYDSIILTICFDEIWKKTVENMKIAFIWEITPRSNPL